MNKCEIHGCKVSYSVKGKESELHASQIANHVTVARLNQDPLHGMKLQMQSQRLLQVIILLYETVEWLRSDLEMRRSDQTCDINSMSLTSHLTMNLICSRLDLFV